MGMRAVAVGALLAGVAWIAAGCGKLTERMVPNLPPETSVFVQGDVDTVNHIVHLFWFGSDPDGELRGFELRFVRVGQNPDTVRWQFTTRTDSLFTVQTADSAVVAPEFQVRAVDQTGLADPTPARQRFRFSNLPPEVTLLNPPTLADTTFPSITLRWSAHDPDGDAGAMIFRVWLRGNESAVRIVTGSSFTIPSEDFRVGGAYVSDTMRAYVQAIDDGGRGSVPASTLWHVLAPFDPPGTRAQLLIVDDVPSSDGNNERNDTLYANTASRNLAPGNWRVLRLDFNRHAFQSARDVEQTAKLFDAVVWYRGNVLTFSSTLRDHQDGLGAYLEAGGRVMLEGLDLIEGYNRNGALRAEFVTRYLGSDGLYRSYSSTLQDSTVSWTIGNNDTPRSSIYDDSLRFDGIYAGLRGFVVRDTNWVAFWARAQNPISPPHAFDLPIGVSVPQPLGGRAIVVTFPLARADRTFVTGGSRNNARVVAKVFQQLLEFGGP